MIERLEGTFWGYQDVELYYQVWRPAGPDQTIVGTMLVTHGLAEHSDCYQKFAEDVAAKGWIVFVWDLRGHGRSEGKRGYVNRFQDFAYDLDAAIRYVKSQFAPRGLPLVLFGHSMGGLVTLQNLVLLSPSGVSALALSSPALGLSLEIPKLKEKGARWLAEWLPKMTLHNEINFDDLVRDENMVRQYKADPLRHDKVSPRLFLGMMEGFEDIKKSAPDIHLPTIMQLAGREKVVNTPASESFFDKLGSKQKQIFIYADSMHEIFNDLDRGDCLKDLFNFLDNLKSTSGGT